jgi:hypothetical protein
MSTLNKNVMSELRDTQIWFKAPRKIFLPIPGTLLASATIFEETG